MMTNTPHPTMASVTAYLDILPNPAKRQDSETLIALMQRLVGEEPKMWGTSIIGFGTYPYTNDSGVEGDMYLAGFAPRKREFVVYLEGEVANQAKLLEKLGPYKTGENCLYIKRLESIDLGVLEELLAASITVLRASNLAAS
jgi:hypothetical protein